MPVPPLEAKVPSLLVAAGEEDDDGTVEFLLSLLSMMHD
jgi:hypothetical protein